MESYMKQYVTNENNEMLSCWSSKIEPKYDYILNILFPSNIPYIPAVDIIQLFTLATLCNS